MRLPIAKIHPDARLPVRANHGDAGLDLFACLDLPVTLPVFGRELIPTGLQFQLPGGYEAQIRPRSGLALQYGVTVLNSPGTVDAGYRGEVGVLLINLGSEPFTVNHGDRVAQVVVVEFAGAIPVEVAAVEPEETIRGARGFGSSDGEAA